jgi:hypothetical protein
LSKFPTLSAFFQFRARALLAPYGGRMKVWWNGEEHNDDENFLWAWLRAVEWSLWPLFIAQPIVPFLLLLNPTRLRLGE